MSQASLFTINAVDVVASPWKSADSKWVARGDDSHDYVLKRPLPTNPELPASEAICYWLSARAGLSTPVWAAIKELDDSISFGSRVEGGITQFSRLGFSEREVVAREISPWLSLLCALDVFVANDDRHWDNALIRQSPVDQRWSFTAMDFSRALWVGGFPKKTCSTLCSGNNNTAATIAILKRLKSWDAARAASIEARLKVVRPKDMSAFVSELPNSWRTKPVRELPKWWGSKSFSARLAELRGATT